MVPAQRKHCPGNFEVIIIMPENWIYRRGDIYLANLNPFKGSEQGGTRPVLVLQNDDGNFYCSTLIVAPLSSKLKKLDLPTHVLLQRGRGLRLTSIVELEQIRTIDKQGALFVIQFYGIL